MDAPRRWQIASIVTAVAGLGLGGAAIARPAVEEAPSITLEPAGEIGDPIPSVPDAAVTDEPTIVTPDVTVTKPHEASSSEVRGDGGSSPASTDSASAASPASVASASPASVVSPDSVNSPASANSPASPDSPASVDSPASIDS